MEKKDIRKKTKMSVVDVLAEMSALVDKNIKTLDVYIADLDAFIATESKKNV